MKYILIIIALLTQLTLNAQSEKGINFQAVARNADGSILSNKDISVRLSLKQGSPDGLIEYQEIKTVSTNVVGLFNLVFGSKENSNIVVIGDYNSINWNNSNKYLQVEIDPINSINFIYLGTQKINYVPYALVAASVDMSNVNGLTNVLKDKLNIGDTSNMLKPYLKASSSINANINGNASTASLAGNITATSNTSITNLINLNTIGTIITGTWSASTIDIAHGGTGVNNLSDLKTILNLDQANNTPDLAKPISKLTQNALNTKEENSNKTTNITTDGTSDIKYPSAKAVKTYVDGITVSGAPDADATTKGIIKLTGDLTGTANLPTITNNAITTAKIANLNVTDEKINSISGSKISGNISGNAATATLAGNITATSNTSLTSLTNLNSIGTITTGTWSASTIDIAHGGTGTTSLSGILLGTNGSGATAIRTAAYGSFYDLTDQTVSAINSPTAMSYSNTDFSEGVSIESNGTKLTRIKVANTGKYNIQFSAQIGRATGNSTEAFSIWLRKNGNDVDASCTDVVIHGTAATADQVASWNFFQNLQANDYLEIMWSSTNTDLLLDYQAARTGPTRPAIPSVILTVQQVY